MMNGKHMNTKEKILETSLRMLNEQGIHKITIRHIAQEMNISHGNLGYHYPNMPAILLALYEQLVGRFDQAFGDFGAEVMGVGHLFKFVDRMSGLFYEYRFLFLDFVGICRLVPEIRLHYRALHQQRNAYLLGLLMEMQSKGMLRSDFSSESFLIMVKALTVVSDFWLPHCEILGSEDPEVNKVVFRELIIGVMKPYLTDDWVDNPSES